MQLTMVRAWFHERVDRMGEERSELAGDKPCFAVYPGPDALKSFLNHPEGTRPMGTLSVWSLISSCAPQGTAKDLHTITAASCT